MPTSRATREIPSFQQPLNSFQSGFRLGSNVQSPDLIPYGAYDVEATWRVGGLRTSVFNAGIAGVSIWFIAAIKIFTNFH